MTGEGEARVLCPTHEALLSAAAITPDIARAAGVYSACELEDLPAELRGWGEAGLPGIVFPWYPASGGPVVYQLRPDRPIPRTEGDGYVKYVFGAGVRLVLNTHPLMVDRVADPSVPLVLIEGTKQYLAGVSALVPGSYAALGMSGCYGWSQDQSPIADLRAVPCTGREVTLCLDADVASNRDVWEAADRLMGWLRTAGAASVKLVELPGGARTGLDDVLAQVADPIDVMARLLTSAKTKLPRKPAKRRAGTFFDDDGGLLANKTATALLAEHPCALAADDTIAVYDHGRYRIQRNALASYVAELLDERHRPIHTSTVMQMVTSKLFLSGRTLPDRPRSALLNVRNGMLDLRTGQLHPHDPEHLSVAQLPVDWDPDATCPTYEAWLTQVCGPEQSADLEEVASTMLDPSVTPHKSIFLFGPSRSGKSTFLRILKAIAGDENTASVTLHQLAEDQFAAASLYGKTLNVAADLSARHVEDISLWKMLTGEDLIYANRKYGLTFNFTNRALFAFSANELPTVGEASAAYFERIKPFKFDHSFAGHEDPTIEATILERELPGVLRRWQLAFVRLRKRGQFHATEGSVAAEFEVQSDRVRLWLTEEMTIVFNYVSGGGRRGLKGEMVAVSAGAVLPPSAGTASAQLYDKFVAWAKANGYSPLGKQKFLRRLTSLNGVLEIRVKPHKIRGLNVVDRHEDHEEESTSGESGKRSTLSPIQITENEDELGKANQTDKSEFCIGNSVDQLPLLPPSTPQNGQVHAPVSALTVAVYDAIAADPIHATERAIRDQLSLSQTEYKSERDYLASRGVIRRRKGRGFELLAELVPTPLVYQPLADPGLINDDNDQPCDLPLLVFADPICAICGGPDDGESAYFPLCEFHRDEVPE